MKKKKLLLALILTCFIVPLNTSAMMNGMNFMIPQTSNNMNMMNTNTIQQQEAAIENAVRGKVVIDVNIPKLYFEENSKTLPKYEEKNIVDIVIEAVIGITGGCSSLKFDENENPFYNAAVCLKRKFVLNKDDIRQISPSESKIETEKNRNLYQPFFVDMMNHTKKNLFNTLMIFENYIFILKFYEKICSRAKDNGYSNEIINSLYNKLNLGKVTLDQALKPDLMFAKFKYDVFENQNLTPAERLYMQNIFKTIYDKKEWKPLKEYINLIEAKFYKNKNINNFNNMNMNNMNFMTFNNKMNMMNNMNMNNMNFKTFNKNMNMNNMNFMAFNNNMNMMNKMNTMNKMNMMNKMNLMKNMKVKGLDTNEMINKFLEDTRKMDDTLESYYWKTKEYLSEAAKKYLNSAKRKVFEYYEERIRKIGLKLEDLYGVNFEHMKLSGYNKINSRSYKEALKEFKLFYLITFIMTKTKDPNIAGMMSEILINEEVGTRNHQLENLLKIKILENKKEIYFMFEKGDNRGNLPTLRNIVELFCDQIHVFS